MCICISVCRLFVASYLINGRIHTDLVFYLKVKESRSVLSFIKKKKTVQTFENYQFFSGGQMGVNIFHRFDQIKIYFNYYILNTQLEAELI